MLRRAYCGCFVIVLSGFFRLSMAQPNREISGRVSDGRNPISNVVIRSSADTNTTFSDTNGNFELRISNPLPSVFISAWKEGYYNGTSIIKNPGSKVELVLTPLPKEDNRSYIWIDPTPHSAGDNYHCGDCHKAIYQQWLSSGHARSSSDSMFLATYNGWNAAGNPLYQPGYRLDYAYSNGNCSNCHAPAAAVKNYIGMNMNELSKVEKQGVICDFCHKIKDIHLKDDKSVNTGIMHIELLRPPRGDHLYLGPYDDSPEPYSYSAVISKSEFCAPCHEGSFWGVPIYETYSEWANSVYAEENIHCQDCHMPSDGITNQVVQSENANVRDPSTIHSHLFRGSEDSSFLASAVQMSTTYDVKKGIIHLSVEIKNVGAGHSIPTGQPMRNMILLIEAYDSHGAPLKYMGENKIPFWGGKGDPADGNYEGLPGKGFAKVLFEHYSQYVQLKLGVKWQHIFPAPQWRVVTIKMNTRIPALTSDRSSYDFVILDKSKPYTITSRLFYRKTFKNWATMKNWKLKDILLAENVIKIK